MHFFKSIIFPKKKGYRGRTYIGYTVDPVQRIGQHNNGIKKGGAYATNAKAPWDMTLFVRDWLFLLIMFNQGQILLEILKKFNVPLEFVPFLFIRAKPCLKSPVFHVTLPHYASKMRGKNLTAVDV